MALTSNEFQLPDCSQPVEEDDDQLPVTSYPCQWIQPKDIKDSTLLMSQAVFEKHTYGKKEKGKKIQKKTSILGQQSTEEQLKTTCLSY